MNPPSLPEFSHIIKDEAAHTYTTVDGQSLRNVTAIIKQLEEPFDADHWAPIKAAENGITEAEQRAAWEDSRKSAMAKGIKFHNQIQTLLEAKDLAPAEYLPETYGFLKWWTNHQQPPHALQPLQSEWVIGDPALGIAGTLDVLFINLQGDLLLYDWKSGKKFLTYSRYSLLFPFEDVPKSELHCYSLQVSLYRLILRRAGLPQVRTGKIVHFTADGNFQVYNALDYADRLEAWLTKQPHLIQS